jgi:N5-(carboxyethyl)ornithine synthase
MAKIGFPKPRMKDERRIAMLPSDISRVSNPALLFFEKGYGLEHEISDEEYLEKGSNIVSAKEAYSLDVVCQPKFCDGDLELLADNRMVFGWLHLYKRNKLTEELKRKKTTAVAWEKMRKGKNIIFHENSVITGKIGVLSSIGYSGKMPEECKIALIGNGRVGKGVMDSLSKLKVKKKNISVYNSTNSHTLADNIYEYDTIINCAPTNNKILGKENLSQLRPGALVIDIGGNAIQAGYKAHSIYSPFIPINEGRNTVYCVNHIPTLVYKTASRHISRNVAPYISLLSEDKTSKVLDNALVLKDGVPIQGRVLDATR